MVLVSLVLDLTCSSQANGRCVTNKSFHKLGNIHDLEVSLENRLTLTAHFFLSHWVHLSALMFWVADKFWVADNLFHTGWNGNLELWILISPWLHFFLAILIDQGGTVRAAIKEIISLVLTQLLSKLSNPTR